MLMRLEYLCWFVSFGAWLVLCCEICAAVDLARDGASYRWLDGYPLPYGERKSSFATETLKQASKRLTKLRTASGFGRRKRVDAKIKKLQMGMLRTAIGFGKRSMEYRTPETEQPLLLKIGPPPKENYLFEWNYEDTPENDQYELLRTIRKFQELKHRTNEDASSQTEEPEQAYHFNRFTSNNFNVDDEQ